MQLGSKSACNGRPCRVSLKGNWQGVCKGSGRVSNVRTCHALCWSVHVCTEGFEWQGTHLRARTRAKLVGTHGTQNRDTGYEFEWVVAHWDVLLPAKRPLNTRSDGTPVYANAELR